ncbi:MAG: trypsin-like peptidase domain-containing protein [Bradyrhizobiaceae bacterium]|nr:trypsin-like peptidase domain-containing protein [Bradyrhizobiaceae bacterium]
MRISLGSLLLATLGAAFASSPFSSTVEREFLATPTERPAPYVRAVSLDPDRRLPPSEFARYAGIGLPEFHAQYGASGLVRCGTAVGSGQLTLANNVITTAAHVFIAAGGTPRNPSCVFEPAGNPGKSIAIDMHSIIAGSATPMDDRATLDWAVARLSMPLDGVKPYALGTTPEISSRVLMYGGGNGEAGNMGVERCSIRSETATSPEGIQEVSFDCSAAHGGSGSALLNENREVVGIFVGYRTLDAKAARPFSATHYNFAITIDGAFRRALILAARESRRETGHGDGDITGQIRREQIDPTGTDAAASRR